MASKTSKTKIQGEAMRMLADDHKLVRKLFRDFKSAEDDDERVAIAQEICRELTVHAMIEEEIFYPALRERAEKEELQDLVGEAYEEHGLAKVLIAEIAEGSLEAEVLKAKMTVLSEIIRHHVEEEEDDIFVKARRLDLDDLVQPLQMRKQELMEMSEQDAQGFVALGMKAAEASRGPQGAEAGAQSLQ